MQEIGSEPTNLKKDDLRQGLKSGFNFKELIKEGENIEDIESIQGSESQNPVSDRWEKTPREEQKGPEQN